LLSDVSIFTGELMKRLLVLTLIGSMASLGSGTAAFAAEGFAQSAVRIAREAARVEAASSNTVAVAGSRTDAVVDSQASMWIKNVRSSTEAKAAQDAGVLSESGMGKGKKAAIFLALGLGFAAAAWSIDHHVQDITPSSLGTRQD
jgi:hypothetical protein